MHWFLGNEVVPLETAPAAEQGHEGTARPWATGTLEGHRGGLADRIPSWVRQWRLLG